MAVVRLVQNVEIFFLQTYATKTISAAAEADRPDAIRAGGEAFAERAMRAAEAAGTAIAVSAIRAVCTRRAVVAAREVFAVFAECGFDAAFAAIARHARHIFGAAPLRRHELAEA